MFGKYSLQLQRVRVKVSRGKRSNSPAYITAIGCTSRIETTPSLTLLIVAHIPLSTVEIGNDSWSSLYLSPGRYSRSCSLRGDVRAMRKASVDRISGTGRGRSVIIGKYCRPDESGNAKTFFPLSVDRFPDRVRPAEKPICDQLGAARTMQFSRRKTRSDRWPIVSRTIPQTTRKRVDAFGKFPVTDATICRFLLQIRSPVNWATLHFAHSYFCDIRTHCF
ncbi:hypothetical protein K0M31_006979 [Melipona bicolor]|uniref:Uncharacterized protein n=1 Tax=Melipona bicolor TaxID=60889 RepID=A0AA40FRH8_9HYME|nr:hypothetical protein K0M31_006979 [Melipona bicolor]